MKILFNTYYHAFQNPGGGEIVLLKTQKALKKHDVHVTLFNQWEDKISKYDIVHNFSTVNSRDFDGLKKYCPKLVVTPVVWPNIDPITCLKEKSIGMFKNILNRKSSEVNYWNALHAIDHLFPTTQMELDRIHLRYQIPKEKMSVVPNAVEEPTYPLIYGVNHFTESNKLKDYYLYVGRISPQKNVHLIIDAVLKIGGNIVIIGDHDIHNKAYANNLKNTHRNNSHVSFMGSLPLDSEVLHQVYLGAKGLIVASSFETCSIVGLEAGIRGIPVFMTKFGATTEVYKNKVKYINPIDADSIAKTIQDQWSQTEKTELKKFIESNYTWDKVAIQLKNKYQGILKN